MKYILDNAADIAAIILAVKVVAVIVVKLTPTPKDDTILAKVLPFVEKAANFLSVRGKTPTK